MRSADRAQPKSPPTSAGVPRRGGVQGSASAGQVGALLRLQASAGNQAVLRVLARTRRQLPAGERTLQRYAGHRYLTLNDGRRILGNLSNGSAYFVTSDAVWKRKNANPPAGSTETNDWAERDKNWYQRYEPKEFVEDCLHTAEEIINNEEFDYDEEREHSQVRGTGSVFGCDYWENQDVAKAAGHDHADGAANPTVGEAFAIVELGELTKEDDGGVSFPGPKGYPYHAAGVVAEDGTDRVTIEATAGSTASSSDHDTRGICDIYCIGDTEGHSFHTRYVADYDTARTIVLEPYNGEQQCEDDTAVEET